MKNKDLLAKIKRAFTLNVPDIKSNVISEVTGQKGKAIIMTNEPKKRRSVMKTVTALTAAAAVFAFALLSGIFYSNNYTKSSVVSLDVNPSIEISISKSERVLDVTAKNADGQLIIGDMDFDGAKLDVVVNALIGSMLRNGYLNDLANSILISVDGNNADRNAALQAELTKTVDSILNTEAFSASIMSQTIDKNDRLRELADEFNITVGKAQLISDIVATNELYTFADLVPLSINELNIISSASDTTLEHVESQGQASDKSYIGTETAKDIAVEHAKVALSDAKFERTELDFDDGVMIYDVEFRVDGVEYDYEINAVTGAIVEFDIDNDGKLNNNTPNNSGNNNGNGNNSGSNGGNGNNSGSNGGNGNNAGSNGGNGNNSDSNGGNGNNSGSNGGNGNNAGSNSGNGNNDKNNSSSQGQSSATLITEDRAKTIVLSHAGVSADSVKYFRIELDYDDGVKKYEIEFFADGVEYEYDINAATGTIIKSEREQEKKPSGDGFQSGSSQSGNSTSNLLGKDKAKEIALSHAGLTEDAVRGFSIELDSDDGILKYEIEFRSGSDEYEYEINAISGDIVKSERDRDD